MPVYVRTLLFTGPRDEVEAALPGHGDHVAQLDSEGMLRFAGTFHAGDGCLEIFEAKDLIEAEAVARSSPLVAEGLGTWMLREIDVRRP